MGPYTRKLYSCATAVMAIVNAIPTAGPRPRPRIVELPIIPAYEIAIAREPSQLCRHGPIIDSIPHENAFIFCSSNFIIKCLADREASKLECIVSGRTSTAAFVVVMLWRVLRE